TLAIKNPNDIYFGDRKLCGILTESKVQGEQLLLAVTGIGLNVSGDLSQFPQELQNTATTLQLCAPDQNLSIDLARDWVMEAMAQLILKYKYYKSCGCV
ncbi:MAG: hypothetical protein K2L24_01930, partial [Opitutales bacterium]|nr:hypothetical protein [Opitutales bacterium]